MFDQHGRDALQGGSLQRLVELMPIALQLLEFPSLHAWRTTPRQWTPEPGDHAYLVGEHLYSLCHASLEITTVTFRVNTETLGFANGKHHRWLCGPKLHMSCERILDLFRDNEKATSVYCSSMDAYSYNVSNADLRQRSRTYTCMHEMPCPSHLEPSHHVVSE